MRGQIFFSCALVALATTAYAAPVDLVEKRDPIVPVAKIGTVNVGRDYFYRREDEAAAAPAAG
jgi:hypothetical protein